MNSIPFKGRNESGAYFLNYLFKEGKTFIMDNHLAAGWCWLQIVDTSKKYNFLHIDRHYDLGNDQVGWWLEKLNSINFNYQKIAIQDLTNIFHTIKDYPPAGQHPLFTWDNYITILNTYYPKLWETVTFATHKEGDLIDNFINDEPESYRLIKEMGYLLKKSDKIKYVINLDVDYFFIEYDGKFIQYFSDDFIRLFAKQIKKGWDNIVVFTIALSPECCGGWENSERIAKILMDELGLNWNLQ